MNRFQLVVAPFVAVLLLGTPAIADEVVGTLTLGSMSRISIDGGEPLPIPAGSTIAMTFGVPRGNGDLPVTISPNDVQIQPVRLPDGRRMKYSITGPARGTLRGDVLTFSTTIRVSLAAKEGREARSYPLIFTTQQTVALNEKRSRVIQASGSDISRASKSVKLVAGATNDRDAAVGKGAAVTAVLSGTFDRLP